MTLLACPGCAGHPRHTAWVAQVPGQWHLPSLSRIISWRSLSALPCSQPSTSRALQVTHSWVCACPTEHLGSSPDHRARQGGAAQGLKAGKQRQSRMGQNWGQAGTAAAPCRWRTGWAELCPREAVFAIGTVSVMGCHCCHPTGHSMCSKEPQAFLTILYLHFRQRERKFVLTFAFISK